SECSVRVHSAAGSKPLFGAAATTTSSSTPTFSFGSGATTTAGTGSSLFGGGVAAATTTPAAAAPFSFGGSAAAAPAAGTSLFGAKPRIWSTCFHNHCFFFSLRQYCSSCVDWILLSSEVQPPLVPPSSVVQYLQHQRLQPVPPSSDLRPPRLLDPVCSVSHPLLQLFLLVVSPSVPLLPLLLHRRSLWIYLHCSHRHYHFPVSVLPQPLQPLAVSLAALRLLHLLQEERRCSAVQPLLRPQLLDHLCSVAQPLPLPLGPLYSVLHPPLRLLPLQEVYSVPLQPPRQRQEEEEVSSELRPPRLLLLLLLLLGVSSVQLRLLQLRLLPLACLSSVPLLLPPLLQPLRPVDCSERRPLLRLLQLPLLAVSSGDYESCSPSGRRSLWSDNHDFRSTFCWRTIRSPSRCCSLHFGYLSLRHCDFCSCCTCCQSPLRG
ncbi:hypothetical protein PENTCL1PPCAC_30626, partial [Pristionchus entomophagus]